MKRINTVLAIILFVMAGCGSNKQSTDDFIIVDVTGSYPEKELILQDFMDVEYIPLETTGEFITQGIVNYVGKEVILVTNRINDGDIFIFDRTGKALRKINRKGQGSEEYTNITQIVLDEDNNEIFVIAYSVRKIMVYDLYGNFKRSFNFIETGYYTDVFNYDRNNLICYYSYVTGNIQPSHLMISKQDGSITRRIQIPSKEIKSLVMIRNTNGEVNVVNPGTYSTIPYNDNWILVETSSDTVYRYLPDGNISPFIVRVPSIYSMDTEVFLNLSIITDRYYFMRTVKKEYDFATGIGFPITNLAYDREANAIFKYIVYNDDFSNKRKVNVFKPSVNNEIAFWESLEAHQLVESYKKGELKGRLKDIAAELDEESNPVIMLVKHKK
ncbi:MAG: 6-bladed beta-propeller [Tannerella sp.]|jgi:hypothetical protein|nr:6-bladed beta-propeller [Tannerella sp.]